MLDPTLGLKDILTDTREPHIIREITGSKSLTAWLTTIEASALISCMKRHRLRHEGTGSLGFGLGMPERGRSSAHALNKNVIDVHETYKRLFIILAFYHRIYFEFSL